jgi:hypothetical protein
MNENFNEISLMKKFGHHFMDDPYFTFSFHGISSMNAHK